MITFFCNVFSRSILIIPVLYAVVLCVYARRLLLQWDHIICGELKNCDYVIHYISQIETGRSKITPQQQKQISNNTTKWQHTRAKKIYYKYDVQFDYEGQLTITNMSSRLICSWLFSIWHGLWFFAQFFFSLLLLWLLLPIMRFGILTETAYDISCEHRLDNTIRWWGNRLDVKVREEERINV